MYGWGAMEYHERLGIPEYEFRLIIGRTKIEYDEEKEEKNRRNHGYSLESAVYVLENSFCPSTIVLWRSPMRSMRAAKSVT